MELKELTTVATPRPWKHWKFAGGERAFGPILGVVAGAAGPGNCEYGKDQEAREANAALIVHCVNTHAELVEALKDCLVYDCKRGDAPARVRALAALAKAHNIK